MIVSVPLAKPVVSTFPRSTVVTPLVSVSETGTAVEVKSVLPLGSVTVNDAETIVGSFTVGLDLGRDVDHAARARVGRRHDDAAHEDRLGTKRQQARHAPRDLGGAPWAATVTVKLAGTSVFNDSVNVKVGRARAGAERLAGLDRHRRTG